jgi:2-polyprenyl-6-methoxyphenol hydroxylase-like FAD-dependent oxidoreductase
MCPRSLLEPRPPEGTTVVVVGASIAGLLAAAAASRHADRVVLLERDELPDRPAARPSTPQAPHSHGLLASGRWAMDELVPGFSERMVAAGALPGDLGTGVHWYVGGARLAELELDLPALAASRLSVEHTLRELVRALPQVELHDGVGVTGLRGSPDRVTGVEVRLPGEPDAHEVAADLVVDASGRPSRGVTWLSALGVQEPEEVRVMVGVRYVTVHVPSEVGDADGRMAVISAATPRCPHFGGALRQEDDTWTITLADYGDSPMPNDAEGLRRAATRITAPEIASLLDGRELLHEPLHHRFPDCRRRRFEKIRLPLGYAPVGDAICSFDPTFGQGMSVAGLEAVALGEELGDGLEAVRVRYPRRTATIVDRAWAIVLGTVLDLPGVTGRRPPGHPVITRYLARAQHAARTDHTAARALFEALNLTGAPEHLMSPRVAAHVLWPRPAG